VSGTRTTASASPAWLRSPSDSGRGDQDVTALVVAWSASDARRIGEVCLFEDDAPPQILGRGAPSATDTSGERVALVRQRPGSVEPAHALEDPGISRDQIRIRPGKGTLEVESIGRCPMLLNGQPVARGVVSPGDTLALRHQIVLVCVRRRAVLPPLRFFPLGRAPTFGAPDAFGLAGESPGAWRLRDEVAFAAFSEEHVLLLGDSGTGKELAARCVHGLSRRARHSLIARNAATVPAGIADAELFGNVKNYPNPGMPERPGIVGEADGGTLFLDEIGELPSELQAHLLRVLDSGGEYHRLGEAKPRRADVRLVAATNRAPEALKHDLLARLTLRIRAPGLPDRIEDIPLLARHLLLRAAERTPAVGARFFEGWDGRTGEPRIDPDLVEALARHHFTTHVRELDTLLWQALSQSEGDYIALTDELREDLQRAEPLEPEAPAVDRPEPTKDEILACLARHSGKQSTAWRDLGLRSRYALYRLLRKHGVVGGRSTADGGGQES